MAISVDYLSPNRILAHAFLTFIGVLISTPASADDSANVAFDQGSVLVICGERVTGSDLSSDEFYAGFPEWITPLQAKANQGVVTRAHYLGRLKEGVFIVFGGPDREAAMRNATDIIAELTSVYVRVTGNEGVEICRSYEIGPIAVLPK